MTPAEPVPYITEAEYLESEQYAEVKSEYFDGQAHPMTDNGLLTGLGGASDAHELVAGNFCVALLFHVRATGFRVYKSEMKLRLLFRQQPVFFYPDVMVAFDRADGDEYFQQEPKLIVEVLGENRNRDLIEKSAVYTTAPTLEEYVTVDPNAEAPEVRILRRSNGWNPEIVRGQESEFTLQSVDLTIKVADLFLV